MREHEVFAGPHHIDVTATKEQPVPKAWQAALPGQTTVALLPLVDGTYRGHPGWCTSLAELAGPEIEVMCGGANTKQPTHQGLWRQGNLLHFGFQPEPAHLNGNGRALLCNAIAYIARFTSDRPIVRVRTFADPQGALAAPWQLDALLGREALTAAQLAQRFAKPWSEQLAALDDAAALAFVQARRGAFRADGNRFAFDPDAVELGLDLRERAAIDRLLELADEERARRLLARLLPEAPPDATAANWRNWVRARTAALCFDPLGAVWRVDPLAQARGVPGLELRGPARADGLAQGDPAARALAEQVAAFAGGARAFDDLQTFTCRLGDVHCFWDRSRGLFRMENHAGAPAARATPWLAAVYDTAADLDRVRGGGPAPRPTVSAKATFRELLTRAFLPLLLLEPSTSLRLLPAQDGDQGLVRLQARLGGRCLDPKQVHVLLVDGRTGEPAAFEVQGREGAPAQRWTITGWQQVGPLRLPTGLRRQGGRGAATAFADPVWNPALPDGAWDEPGLLSGR